MTDRLKGSADTAIANIKDEMCVTIRRVGMSPYVASINLSEEAGRLVGIIDDLIKVRLATTLSEVFEAGRREEREACARIAETEDCNEAEEEYADGYSDACFYIATTIRSRESTP